MQNEKVANTNGMSREQLRHGTCIQMRVSVIAMGAEVVGPTTQLLLTSPDHSRAKSSDGHDQVAGNKVAVIGGSRPRQAHFSAHLLHRRLCLSVEYMWNTQSVVTTECDVAIVSTFQCPE